MLKKRAFELRSHVTAKVDMGVANKLVTLWSQANRRSFDPPEQLRVGRDTQIVVDGFQGSGNTFLVEALFSGNGRTINIAHHLHSPYQVMQGVRRGIPVFVVVRQPEFAVSSIVRKWPRIEAESALKAYIRYYKAVGGGAGEVDFVPFDRIEKDVVGVIRQIAGTSGMNLEMPEREFLSSKVVPGGDSTVKEESERKRKALERARTIERQVSDRRLQEAREIYRRLVGAEVS